MFRIFLFSLLLAVGTNAFSTPVPNRAVVYRERKIGMLRMAEDPNAVETDPMDAAMEEMDDATREMMEKVKRAQLLREQEVFMKKSTGKHKCTNCDWEYDQEKGDSMMIGGMIKPGTAFAELPSDWRCPVCRA